MQELVLFLCFLYKDYRIFKHKSNGFAVYMVRYMSKYRIMKIIQQNPNVYMRLKNKFKIILFRGLFFEYRIIEDDCE